MRLRASLVLLAAVVLVSGCGGGGHRHPGVISTAPPPPPPSAVTTSPAPAPVPPPPPPASAPVAAAAPMLWRAAGAFVWHPTAIDPALLGAELRTNGFGWAAVFVHDGLTSAPLDPVWIDRFRHASGLPLGGWGVLRTDPIHEAELARTLIARYHLDFYVADAEAEYGYTGPEGSSGARFDRSRKFVDEFRRLEPGLPAAVASYCRPDQHDLDWESWSAAGFDFLPEAYVNELGAPVDPSACASGAAAYFPAERVHPIVGMYQGKLGLGAVGPYSQLLHQARTTGFSVYLAEQGMTPAKWAAFGQAIAQLGIAVRPG